MRWFLCALGTSFLMCALAGCGGAEEGADAGKIPAPTPPPDLQKLFQRPDNKKAPSRKGAQLFGPLPGDRAVAALDHRIA